jgi:kynureninase
VTAPSPGAYPEPPVPLQGMRPEDLYRAPNALARHYSRFRVADRLLLTGHSHQAWPDVGFEAQQQAWLDAARHVDGKWEHAFERAERVRAGYRRLLGGADGEIALGANTHELLVRFLSALPLRERPRLVTTDGEFHTVRRQLDRLAEEGIEVVKLAAEPVETLPERLAAAVDGRTAAVLVSTVFYRTARIVSGAGEVARACRRHGAELLLDVYHHLNVLPLSLEEEGVADAFVTGGGYKYCQLGEGAAFLRVPPGRELRPAVTGWFSEFSALSGGDRDGRVPYGQGADRWAGATYDPTSHYRAAAVFEFFAETGLTPELLREVSRHQVGLLAERFDALGLDLALASRDRSVPLAEVAGFLALESPHAGRLHERLRERGVLTDYRGTVLRLGPAPYLADEQLERAVAALGECARGLDRVG